MMPESRRNAYLEEMGLGPLWRLREPGCVNRTAEGTGAPEAMPEPAAELPAESPAWMPLPDEPQAPVHERSGAPDVAGMGWPELKQAVAACTRCGLCAGRHNTVFGVGDERARWLFVGEGPGRNEDLQGEPFVGKAGKLLDNMLRALGLRRGENAYIANVVKCRPTDGSGQDRPPTPEEIAACLPYLERQIALIRPQVIVALGKTAALALLGLDPDTPVSRLRGKIHRYGDCPLIVTYHPAYLLRNMADKKKAWADLCLAMSANASAG